jgi:phosphatidylserine decarboxylase
MTFAREGYPFIGGATVLALGAYALALGRRSYALWILAVVLTIVALWVAYFFRDPERMGPRGDQYVISPADGLVLPVVQVEEPSFIHGGAQRISIFMNIFNVHVNRYPIDGQVSYVHYNPGKFVSAHLDKASLENEQMSVGISSPRGPVLVRQIAGLIARRIVNYSRNGERAAQGSRFGLIRFGSRVDVFVPRDAVIKVRPGEKVVAGTTVLAELPSK